MLLGKFCGLLDVLKSKNFSCEIRFHDVLQSGHFGVIEKTAPRAHVRINKSRIERVLPPMTKLVTVSVQDRVESKRLDGDLLCPMPRFPSLGDDGEVPRDDGEGTALVVPKVLPQ